MQLHQSETHRTKPVLLTRTANYTQANRPIAIDTPLGPDRLLLKRFELEESISNPFEVRCELLSSDPQIDVLKLVHEPVAIRLDDGRESRFFHAIVRDIQQLEPTSKLNRYAMTAVPDLWFLSLGQDCRIFQDMSVDEIVDQVLRDHHIPHRFVLRGKYEKRTFCVQYRESYLQFISRLMEDEGIYYYFEHSATGNTLVLADQSMSATIVPNHETIRFHSDRHENLRIENVVFELERHCEATIDCVSLNDFDFTKPRAFLYGTVANAHKHELYDYPGLHETLSEAERNARLQIEEYDTSMDGVRGKSTIKGLLLASRTTLASHHTNVLNREYFITSVLHRAADSVHETSNTPDHEFVYENSFTMIPRLTPFRPARKTPRPLVNGSQTAIVVGPKGEEIHTDQYGRIKVQFHWDRRGKHDAHSSCWIRVSQAWSGARWGTISIPRIGQEVVVDYLEGNPDRPIITGRVYNSDQMPPYDLPGKKNISGTRSQTVNGGGHNEIVIDDTAGAELVRIRSQHDMLRQVLHDDVTSVGNEQTITVGAKKMEMVGTDRIEVVGANNVVQIGNNQKVTVGDNILIEAGTSITFQCGASRIHMNQAGVISITGLMINIAGGINTNVTAPLTTISGLGLITSGVLSLNTGVSYNVIGGVTNVQGGTVNING